MCMCVAHLNCIYALYGHMLNLVFNESSARVN
jgi:hypothetical protein